jgi:phage terminase small subunit
MTKTRKEPPKPKGLSPKQSLFVVHYIGDCNWSATKAALAAGYSPNNAHSQGSENLKHPAVMAAIAEAMQDRIERTKVDADYVLNRLVAVEMEATAIRQTVPTMQVRLKTLELIGKHVDVRAFRDQVGLSNTMGGPVEEDLSHMTEEELEAYGVAARIVERARSRARQAAPSAEPDSV